MREMKFRYRILDDHTGNIIKVVYSLKDIEKKDFHELGTILSRDEFIGLKAKNRKEIYEGDIVSFKGMICKVEYFWEEGEFILRNEEGIGHSFKCLAKEYEVIGNVWENKELLEK